MPLARSRFNYRSSFNFGSDVYSIPDRPVATNLREGVRDQGSGPVAFSSQDPHYSCHEKERQQPSRVVSQGQLILGLRPYPQPLPLARGRGFITYLGGAS